MIDQQTIQRIFDTADIVDVVGDFVALKRAGQNYKGLSPFTNEKTPSFFVSPAKGIFKCFSTGRGGNAVRFLMEHEKMSYPEALKYLAKKYNIEIVENEPTREEVQQQNERESLLIATKFAHHYFVSYMHKTDEGKAIGLSYFHERGFKDHIIKKFELGFSPQERDAFTKHALFKGYKKEILLKSGLSSERNNYIYDRFNGRAMFPIHSISGQVIGFGGRVLKKDEKTAKYLNSPESEIYHKSNILYGLFFAKNEIVKQNKCYMVEGYTDVLSMVQAGIENVVSSSGTSLTEGQVALVKRFTNNLTIIYDGDPAGIKASLRGIDIVLQQGMNVKVLLLPEGEDPDSFAKNTNATDFLRYIEENEKDFISFKTRLLLQESGNDPVKKAGLINDIVRSIAIIPDRITRTVYARECSRLMDMEEHVIQGEINKLRYKQKSEEQKKEHYKSISSKLSTENKETAFLLAPGDAAEKDVIRLLLNFGQHILYYKENKKPEPVSLAKHIIKEFEEDELGFDNPVYQILFNEIKKYETEKTAWDITTFTKHMQHEISSVVVDIITSEYSLSKIWTKNDNYIQTEEMKLSENVPLILTSFKARKVMKMLHDAQNELKQITNESPFEEIVEIQQRINILNEIKKEFSKNLGNRIIL